MGTEADNDDSMCGSKTAGVNHNAGKIQSLDRTKLRHVDVDGIFNFLGRYGRYQMTQVFLQSICYATISIPIVHGIFVGKFVDFRCAETGTSFNRSTLLENYTLDLSECNAKVKNNVTSGTMYEETCTDYEYEGGDTCVSYISEWDLVCSKEVLGQLPQVIIGVGQGFGAGLIPQLGDRFGRRIVMIVTIIALFVGMFVSSFVQQFEFFLVLRFFMGAFIQGAYVTVGTMTLEVVPIELRAWVSLTQSMSWIVALGINGLMGYFLRHADWRMLQLAYALVCGIPSISTLFFLDDSLRWLAGNSKIKEADRILRKACQWNNKDYETLRDKIASNSMNDNTEKNSIMNGETTDKEEEYHHKPIDLIKNKNTRKITFVMCYTWLIIALTFYGIILMSTSLAGDPYVNYFLTALVEIPAGITGFYMLKNLDRKPTMIGFNLVSATALLLVVLVSNVAPSQNPYIILQTCLTLVGQFFVIQIFLFVWIYTPELYPTNLRSLGLGISSSAGRVGASFSPLFTILARKVPWAPGALFGGGCLVCASLLTMLPETRHVPLPDTLQDVDNMFKKSRKRFSDQLESSKC